MLDQATVAAFPENVGGSLIQVPDDTPVDNVFTFSSDGKIWQKVFDGGNSVYRVSWLFTTSAPTNKQALVAIALANPAIQRLEVDVPIEITGAIDANGKTIERRAGGLITGAYIISNANFEGSLTQQMLEPTGTLTNCRSNTGKWHPTWFGAKGDGSTDDYTSVNFTVGVANTNVQKTVNLIQGNYNLGTNLSIPSGVVLQFELGAMLSGSVTLSGAGNFDSRLQQIFGSNITVSGLYALSGKVSPQLWGAVGNNSGNDAPAINRMFAYVLTIPNNLINVYFPPKRYRTTESIIIPNVVTPNITINIYGYGATISNNEDVVIWKRMPDDNAQANNLISTIFIVKGFRIVGNSTVPTPLTNQIGMQFGALYTCCFEDLQFEYCYDGLRLEFALGCKISRIRSTFHTNNAITGRYGTWTAASPSNSSFNGNRITDCRVFSYNGAFSALYLLGADQTIVNNFISEGPRPKYGIYYNYAGNTTVNINTFEDIWFENSSGTVFARNTNFYIRNPTFTNIVRPQMDYDDIFMEVDSVSGGWQIDVSGIQYFPGSAPCFSFTGTTDGILVVKDCKPSIDATFRDPTFWVGGVVPNLRIEGRANSIDPDMVGDGWKEYTSGNAVIDASASVIVRSYATSSTVPVFRILRPASITNTNPLLAAISGAISANANISSGLALFVSNSSSSDNRNRGPVIVNSGDSGNNSPSISTIKTAGTLSAPTTVASGNTLFEGIYYGYTTTPNIAAFLRIAVDGSPATGRVPGRWRFYVTNSAGSQIEALGIRATGLIEFTQTPTAGATTDSILVRNSTAGEIRQIAVTALIATGAQYQLAYYNAAGTAVSPLTLITAARILISDANGLPIASNIQHSSGKYGIGLAPTAVITLPSGTATANTAPLKLTAGIVLSVPESGVIETDANNDIYYSNATARGKISVETQLSTAAGTLAMTVAYRNIVFTGTTSTFTLPPVATSTGSRIFIINKGSGTITVNSNAGGNDIWDAGSVSATTPITTGQVTQLYCDGSTWDIIP